MRYILSILILLCSVTAFGQVPEQFLGSPGNRIVVRGQLKIDSSLIVPIRLDTLFIPGTANALVYNSSDKRIYYYNGLRWHGVMYGDSLVYATAFGVDTAKSNIRSEIALSLDSIVIYTASGTNPDTLYSYKDGDSVLVGYIPKFTGITTDATLTGNGLSGNPLKADTIVLSTRQWRQKGIDSLNSVLRQTIADSAATKLDSIHVYAASDPDPDTLYSYKNGDSVFIGLIQKPGISTTWGTIGGTLSDQTDLQSALDTKLDSLHIYTASDPDPDTIYQYKSGDSSLVGYIPKGGALEAVTTDATLTGDGTAGDPLKVDTLLISTRAWRQKGDDSLGAIIATKLSAVNLDTTRTATTVTITNDGGTDAVVPLVNFEATLAGLMSPEDKGRLDSLYAGLLTDTLVIGAEGTGETIVYARNDTLFAKRINCTGCTIDTESDSTIRITVTATGTPGGNNTEVQFNDGGAFGGDTGFTFDKTTNEVTVDSLTAFHVYADSMRATLRILAGSAIQPFNSLVTETIEMEAVGDQPIISILDTNTDASSSSLLWFRGMYSGLTNTKKILGYIEGLSDANGGQLKLYGTAANQAATYNLGLTVRQTGRVVVGASSGSNTARFDVFDATGEHMRLMQATGVYAAFRVFTAGSGILRITTTGAQITTDRLHLGGASTPVFSEYMLNVDGSVRINDDSLTLHSTRGTTLVAVEDSVTGEVGKMDFATVNNYLLQFTDTTAVVVTNTATETTIYGGGAGSATIDGLTQISAGNKIVLKGTGTIDTDESVPGPFDLTFNVGAGTLTFSNIVLATNLNNAYYDYEYELIPEATGTNQNALYRARLYIDNGGTAFFRQSNGVTTLSTDGNIVCNVTVTWDADAVNVSNRFESLFNTIEIYKR